MIKKRFNPIKDKSSEIIEFLMSSPDIPDDDILQFKLRLSIEEAVDNVVRYAYDGGIGWLEAGTRIEGCAEMSFAHRGSSSHERLTVLVFTLIDHEFATIYRYVVKCLGARCAVRCKKMMDSINYRYENGNNVLTMTKKLN